MPPTGNHRRRRTAAPAAPAVAIPAPSDGAVCPLCASEMADVAVGACSHGVCAACSHRMRLLYKRRDCAFCKLESRRVCVVAFADYVEGQTTAESVLAWAAGAGVRLHHDKAANMMFVSENLCMRLQVIAGFTCPKFVEALVDDGGGGKSSAKAEATCDAPRYPNVGSLRAHVRDRHGGVLCDVCVLSKTQFKSMLPVYPLDSSGNAKRSSKLADHVKSEHPICNYCQVNMLDDEQLFAHMQKDHEACHLCERDGILHSYFRNFTTLEAHYRSHHFVCEDPACQGVVFGSSFDLQAHVMHSHRADIPRSARGRRLQVDLSELHAPAGRRGGGGGGGGGGSGSGGGSGRGGHGGRGGNVVVNGIRHGLSQASGGGSAGAASSALLTDEDVRLEQERQAARHREFVAVTSAVGDVAADANAAAESSSRSGNRGSSSTGMAMPKETVAARRGRRTTGNTSGANDSARASSSSKKPEAANAADPDDDGFYERPLPDGSPHDPPTRERNKALVSTMMASCDPAEFEQFRSYSADFRSQHISPEEYYNAAVETFGVRNAVRNILPELAALLPSDDLRIPLVDVCVRRNPPKHGPPRSSSSNAVSSTGAAPRPTFTPVPTQSIDSFPNLSGAAASGTGIRPSAPKMRSSVPKPADFPTLGNGGGASKSAAGPGKASGSRNTSQQPSMARVFGSKPADSPSVVHSRSAAGPAAPASSAFPSLPNSKPRPHPARVIEAAPRANPKPTPTVVMHGGAVSGGAAPAASAFPSLSASNSSAVRPNGAASRPKASNMRNQESMFPSLSSSPAASNVLSFAGSNAPSPDVSERAGAVWGGAAAGGGKRRGPGKGRGKTPAPMPDLNPSRPKPVLPPANARRNTGDSSGSGSGGKVLDIPALALQRQAKSALPRVSAGGSYGFAWERKKAITQKAEIKREATQSQATPKARDQSVLPPSSRPEPLSSISASSTVPSQPTPASSISDFDGSSAPHDEGDSATGGVPSSSFDQFSYLDSGSNGGTARNAASSFFES